MRSTGLRGRYAAVCAAGVLLLGACGADDAGDTTRETTEDSPVDSPATQPDTTAAETVPPATEPPGTQAPDGPETTDPAPPPHDVGDPVVDLIEVAQLNLPVNLAWRQGDPRLYVVEQPGRIMAVDPDTGEARAVLDFTELTEARGERGALGLAFHRSGNPAYINHTGTNGDTVIAEYQVNAEGIFDAASRRVVLEIDQPFGNHNGGHLEFGPDDLLYIGMGDGGAGGDPERLALDLSSPHGKILRIDPTATDTGAPYSVPEDNPFANTEGAVPEIFAYGLRNPWKFTFDPLTGDLWIADVGQSSLEEINHVRPGTDGTVAGHGLSFGWSAFEGTERFNADQDSEGHVPPVLVYSHGPECSITGGAVYRGSAISEMSGGYVYSDYCSGRIWVFDPVSERNLAIGSANSVTAVLPGPDQEMYVLSHTGALQRLVPGN